MKSIDIKSILNPNRGYRLSDDWPAAPELLTALRRLVEWDQYIEANSDCGQSEAELRRDAEQAARAAIAKATGE